MAFVYNSDIVESQHPFNMELHVNDQRNEDNRVKRMPICGGFRIHMLEFILVNVHLNPKNACQEAHDLFETLIPELEKHYGSIKSQSVIFLKSFNVSYAVEVLLRNPNQKFST